MRGVWCQVPSLSRLPVSGSGHPRPVARVSRAGVVWVWGTQHQPRPPVLRAGCPGPPSTCCWCGCAGVGAQHRPFGLHALQGAACRGGGGRLFQGGGPSGVVRNVWCQAPSLLRLPPLGGGSQDPLPVCPGHGCAGYGGPSVARCGGGGRASPGGGALCRCEGRLSSGALPPPAARPQWVSEGRSPSPAARPRGGLSGSATHVLWTRVCGLGGSALSLWLACPAWGCVPRRCCEAVLGG